MLRIRVSGQGWGGGPSLNTHYFTSTTEDQAAVDGLLGRVHAAWTSVKGIYPTVVSHNVIADVDVVTPATGVITNTITGSNALATITGGAIAGFSPPVVAVVLSLTSATFIGGRRVRGRAFLSPLNDLMEQSDGTPSATAITDVGAFGGDLRDNTDGFGDLCIWHRPTAGSGGAVAIVTGSSVKDIFAVLRSRRD